MSNHKLVQFNCHKSSKLYSLRVTKDRMRKAVLKAGFNSNMKINDFYRIKIKLNGIEFNGQTILRNFGNESRGTENAKRFLNFIGLEYNPNKSSFEGFDFTDPKQLRLAILKSKIDVLSVPVTKFLNSKIIIGENQITGKKFLIEYYKAVGLNTSYPYSKICYIDLLNRAGFQTNLYTSLLDKSLLRKILDSVNFDFENKRFKVTDFLKMRFNPYNLVGDERNNGVLTGQALLRHYFREKVNFRMEQILTLLRNAGYNVSHMEIINRNRIDLKRLTPDIAKEILEGCTIKVDWEKVSLNQFMVLYFNSKYFKGIGITLLKKLGGTNSIAMRRLLELAKK